MTSKIQHIVDLSVHAARTVVEHPDRWADFLSTAAWNYKYPFQDQLLIYAQRPDATACASIDVWNKRLNRWVKRGAKGIALIEDRGNHFGLRHVFDISDTQSRDPRPVSLWRMEPGDIAVVTETLNNAFGEQEPDAAWPNALLSAARNAVDDNSSDYVDLLVRELEGSLLEELERQPVEVLFRQIAYHSVAYMALTRCGMNASHYIGREDLSGIGNFNTLPALSQLGAAISDIAEMMLREIESTIRVQRRVERQTSQARDVRTVARETALTQNEAKRLPERTDEHGSDLHPSRGLSAARPDTDRGSSTDRQVWDVAQKLPENREERHIRQPAALGRTAPASDGNRPVGADAARTDDERTAPSAPGPGQSERSAGLDGLHEQPEATGGGDHSDGTDLQLKWYDRKTEDRSLPFFHDHNAINDLLRTAPLLKSKSEIEAFFAAHENEGERALYVRSLFAPGQSELTLDEDLLIGYEPYRNVLHLWTGPATEPTAQSFYDWEVIAGHINSMIVLNEFDPARKTEPSVQQQTLFMEQAEADTASAFVWPQAVIDAILQQGSGFANSKYRIALHFQQSLSEKENAEFLKREYGTGGRAPVLIGTDIYEHHDSKGITLTRRSMTDQEQKLVLPWMKVQKRIGELLAAGRYLNRLETERLPTFAEQQEERRRQMAEEATARERLEQEQPSSSQQSETMERKQARYAYAPGDTVFFGADEYEILLVENGNVMLRDVHFPLFTKELERRDFERILRENPLNDHLLTDEQGVETEAEEPAEKETELELSDGDEPKSASASLQLTEQVSDEAHNEEAPSAPSAVEDVRSVAPQTTAVNYRITDDQLGHGGAKVKYGFNVAAIRLLKQLELEGRQATADEQVVLARYVGWGGIPQVFDEANAQWTAEYAELQSLLEPDEYASARASTLNAHYTSPVVIKAIYGCLERMGFRNGNILEPSCGIGNFFGLVPESFQDSQLFGVELDSITGRIAKQLYPQATIAISGYEETALPDSFFDLAIGNVPFGGYGVADKRYDKHKFLIHDYFFAKTLDKVRPGGIIAFITSKGTMDKQNPAVRKYIAERAELLGAVRLPNNAFQSNAGTEVTADILFLQKRDRMVTVTEQSVEWIGLAETAEGVPINAYFATHPDMVLGTMAFDDRMYGNRQETTCNPYPDANLSELLGEALTNIHADWVEFEREVMPDEEDTSLPADPTVRNFSYTLVDGQLYYRENSRMHRVDTSATAAGRIKGMIRLRDTVRELIEYQTEDYSDEEIREQQRKLNAQYDRFTAQYGLINSRANSLAFADDSAYFLLCSLEVLDEEGKLLRKADMFTKRTIRQRTTVRHVETAEEALGVSIGEKARVDLPYMQELTGMTTEQLVQELRGVIFPNPERLDEKGQPVFETADAYLSGNVRDKLLIARRAAEMDAERYGENVKALEAVQPKDLDASEIDVRLGATWLPPEVIREFIFELVDTPYMFRQSIDVLYSEYTAAWNVRGKSNDRSNNIKANVTFGTNRVNAYKILEDTLNLRDVRIFDTMLENGVEKRVLNKQETAIAQQKQEMLKEAFRDWIWKDPQRRERLTRLYNDRFNAIRPREYDGSHIRFTGMNPEIRLRQHQVNAVARALYGGNSLFAHCVGAGKTFAMTAAAMESKHLGLCSKSMFVVPNHLTEQWAAEFLQLYPSANILVATKKDFETKNRKKFCARIATGDYDAIIIGHSQFEKIPISMERQRQQLEEQIYEITSGIRELKEAKGERYAIKQLEKTRKTLQTKLAKLNDTSRKDDVVTFEELGVDRLFVDEADSYKNLFLYTKMRNVAGLSQTEAQKSSDMFAKCRYLDELTGGRGIIFATGTPISNSITEMYTMQRYLQYERLRKQGLQHFDSWASTFGETVTAIELAPEGTGYRAKTRFARFYNLPELMNMFKEVADIQTADMLQLPVPKSHFHNVAVPPSDFQREMVADLAHRAERVRAKEVEPHEDNMLKITNDGRKLALDQRLANPMLPDDEGSKVSVCADNVFRLWKEHEEKRLAQLVFCDLSIPKQDGTFNVYDELRRKLTEKGVPTEEIAYIHDANTEVKKKELFAKVRTGQIRILLGSTFKMGAGTNVQTKLIALHDLDCPWRPRDLEQRSGRIIRQGNENSEVHIFRYVTENTFDAYLYQTLENKQRFISQIMTSKSPVRSAEDIDEAALSYAEVKALATGNPYIKEKMDLDIQVSKLKLLKANHLSQRYALEDRLLKVLPQQVKSTEDRIAGYEQDVALYLRSKSAVPEGTDESKFPGMVIKDFTYTERAAAGAALLEACKGMTSSEPQEAGSYLGFSLWLSFDSFHKEYKATLRGALDHTISLGMDAGGNITRLNNMLADLPAKLEHSRQQLSTLLQQMETAKEQVEAPFEKEQELLTKSARLAELNALLNMDKRENEAVDSVPDEEPEAPERRVVGRGR
ncbi:DEAD/DEAH box helicase family protein [Paenibacillus woosongensis]|uniref:DEAD/DEAH box helicase family protein n=1 Tax=Paenibacillus woosongensis TaxID=307580 RepID=UPI001BD1060F|nr:DEAD/DEAH box helicase family protein [Paenibacillus woosongensis]